jgi:hypothetical protein
MEVRTKVDQDTELMPQLRIVFYAACNCHQFTNGCMLQYIKFSMSQPSSLRKDFGGYTGSKDFIKIW